MRTKDEVMKDSDRVDFEPTDYRNALKLEVLLDIRDAILFSIYSDPSAGVVNCKSFWEAFNKFKQEKSDG